MTPDHEPGYFHDHEADGSGDDLVKLLGKHEPFKLTSPVGSDGVVGVPALDQRERTFLVKVSLQFVGPERQPDAPDQVWEQRLKRRLRSRSPLRILRGSVAPTVSRAASLATLVLLRRVFGMRPSPFAPVSGSHKPEGNE